MPIYKELVIRLTHHGCNKRPFHRVVVMPKKNPRNSKPLEQLGVYDPVPNNNQECVMSINFTRLYHYLQRGASLSEPMIKLLSVCGYLHPHPMFEIKAQRNKKAAAQAAASEQEEERAQAASEGTPV